MLGVTQQNRSCLHGAPLHDGTHFWSDSQVSPVPSWVSLNSVCLHGCFSALLGFPCAPPSSSMSPISSASPRPPPPLHLPPRPSPCPQFSHSIPSRSLGSILRLSCLTGPHAHPISLLLLGPAEPRPSPILPAGANILTGSGPGLPRRQNSAFP